jgi:hypothetical protein
VYGGDAGHNVWENAIRAKRENTKSLEPTPDTLLKKLAWSTLGTIISQLD